jgi:lipopolysaccharide export LptBFGC system permease protein LptF
MRLSILQKYVVRELLGPLGLGLAVFTFVFLIGQLFRLLDLLLNSGVSGFLGGELVLSLLPGILSITTPMALLVAILLAIGRLAADREILAIRMSGVNLMHICGPVLVVAAILSCVMILANQQLVPFLNLKSADLATQIEFNVLSSIPPNRFYELEGVRQEQSSVFFFEHRNPDTGMMEHVNIKTTLEPIQTEQEREQEKAAREKARSLARKQDKESRAQYAKMMQAKRKKAEEKKVNEALITAQSGTIESSIAERLISIKLTTGSIHFVNQDRPENYNIVEFEGLTKGIRPRMSKTEDGVYEKSPREMSVGELRRQIKERPKPARFRVELFQRFSIPLACIAFALIAIPLAVYVRPTGKAVAFAISFLLILLYYGLLNYGVSLGRTGSSFASLAIFFPNILLALVGSFLLYRMVMR